MRITEEQLAEIEHRFVLGDCDSPAARGSDIGVRTALNAVRIIAGQEAPTEQDALIDAVTEAQMAESEAKRLLSIASGKIKEARDYGDSVMGHPAYDRCDTVPQNDFENLLAILGG